MDPSRKRRVFCVRRWKEFLAGSLCAASLLGVGSVCGQEVAQPVLNPFAKKARPAASRPLGQVVGENPRPASTGGLKPAVIRPAPIDAVHNPHVPQAPQAEAKSLPKPARQLELTPETVENEPAEQPPAPLTIVNESVKGQPAPLTIINESVKPRKLVPPPAEEEHLAPIVPSSAKKRRPMPKPAPSREARFPSPYPATTRPIETTLPDLRPAAQTAAIEEDSAMEDGSAATDVPRPLAAESLLVEAPAAKAPGDESATDESTTLEHLSDESTSSESQPLAPIVSATAARKSQPPAADESAEPRTHIIQLPERSAPRTFLVQNDAQPAEPPAVPAPAEPPPAPAQAEPQPAPVEVAPAGQMPVLPEGSPFEQIKESGSLVVQVRRSLLLRTQKDVFRTAVVDEQICEIVQFTPRELSIIGRSTGSTHVTFWFDDPNMQPVTYVVEVKPDAAEVKKEEEKYLMLEDVLNEMFPDSKIKLTLVASKLIVRGQAKDSEEAFQIMTIVRGQASYRAGVGNAWNVGISEGQAAQVLSDAATGAPNRAQYQIVNMLRVPGVQQVALRVKIAELNRSAARNFGIDIKGTINIGDSSSILLNSLSSVAAGETPPILFNVDGDDISIGLNTLQQHGVVKLLSEPTLVTMSGRPATFLAGGEFAVPTVVGSAGLNAVTTDFRAFGAIISFLPTVVDKDRIRLEVAPEFSEINSQLSTGGASTGSIPSLNVRAATTTVEMREGQTLAIAGLLQDSMTANNAGDLPFLQRIIGRRGVTRNENELIILVTPELVHPMEPEEVPPLPGFDVTEPTNTQFYLHGDLEGNPTMDYRSTVWPRLKKRYKAGGPAMTSGPFGHGQ